MAAPTITTPVSFSGTPKVGELLIVEEAEFAGDTSVTTGIEASPNGTTDWQEIDLNTPGGIIVDNDLLGYSLRGFSTGTNEDGSTTSRSSVIGPIVFLDLGKSKALPVYNSQVIKIVGGATIGTEYDSEFPTVEPIKIRWSGVADSYLKTKMVRSYSSGSVDQYQETIILIPYLAHLDPGCVLTIKQGGVETDYKINDFAPITQDPGLPDAIRCFVVKV